MLPHDALELLLADAEGARAYRMGEHDGGPLWSDPSLVIAREHLDLASLFGQHETVLIADSYQEPRWPRGYFTVDEPVGAEVRSVVGTRIRLPRRRAWPTCWRVASARTCTARRTRALLRRVAG